MKRRRRGRESSASIKQLTTTLHGPGDLSLERSDPDTALRLLPKRSPTPSRRETGTQIYSIAGIACPLFLRGDARSRAPAGETAVDQERRLGFRMLLNEWQR